MLFYMLLQKPTIFINVVTLKILNRTWCLSTIQRLKIVSPCITVWIFKGNRKKSPAMRLKFEAMLLKSSFLLTGSTYLHII